jgi:hypothetical protein
MLTVRRCLAIWVFDWVNGLKGALPNEIISAKQYPKVFAWMKRFNEAVKAAKAAMPKPTTLAGSEATNRVETAIYAEREASNREDDPIKLGKGTEAEIWPVDTDTRHRDSGHLVGINEEEMVLGLPNKAGGGELRLHFPRTNFRIQSVESDISKL